MALRKPFIPFIPLVTINVGAGGRTRTDTAFYSPRILSPVRLPFRHTGKRELLTEIDGKPIRFKLD